MFLASLVSFFVNEIQKLAPGYVYGVVALLVFGEAALFFGFVLPGETTVIVAGVVASQGRVNVGVLCVLVVVCAVVGDSVGYEVGRLYGDRVVEWRLLRSRRGDIDRALDGLQRRGATYVFVGRFTAFLRAVMPGLAGMSGLRYRRFFVANATSGLIWGVAFTLLGYFAGTQLHTIENISSWAGYVVLLLIVLVIGWHLRSRRRRRRSAPTSSGESAQ